MVNRDNLNGWFNENLVIIMMIVNKLSNNNFHY